MHELIHLVHGKMTGFTMDFGRPVASLVFQEGLATQLSKYLVPGYKDEVYVASQKGWLQECCKDVKQILQGIKPFMGKEFDKNEKNKYVLFCSFDYINVLWL